MGKRDITDVTSFGLIRCNWDLKQPFPCQNPAKEVQKCNCGVWRHGRRWSLATAWHVILNIPSSSQSILTSWVQAVSGAVERSLKASRFVRFQNGWVTKEAMAITWRLCRLAGFIFESSTRRIMHNFSWILTKRKANCFWQFYFFYQIIIWLNLFFSVAYDLDFCICRKSAFPKLIPVFIYGQVIHNTD